MREARKSIRKFLPALEIISWGNNDESRGKVFGNPSELYDLVHRSESWDAFIAGFITCRLYVKVFLIDFFYRSKRQRSLRSFN